MIRELRLADLPLQLLPGRLSFRDLAVARRTMVVRPRAASLQQIARWATVPGLHAQAFVDVSDNKLRSLTLLRRRSGPRSWEIAHLYTDPHEVSRLGSLFDRSAGYVASQRGERLFLRVRQGTEIETAAEACGFRWLANEDVFRMERPMATDLRSRTLHLRPPLPEDVYGVFRLYNAAFPASARSGFGVTLDQWRDSAEVGLGKVRDYVWVQDDGVRAWVRFDQVKQVLLIEAMVHPNHAADAATFVGYAAQLAWGHRWPIWVVPGHQLAIARTLIERGWVRTERYSLMARSAALPIEEPALAAARA